jgi:hypothetical protein
MFSPVTHMCSLVHHPDIKHTAGAHFEPGRSLSNRPRDLEKIELVLQCDNQSRESRTPDMIFRTSLRNILDRDFRRVVVNDKPPHPVEAHRLAGHPSEIAVRASPVLGMED